MKRFFKLIGILAGLAVLAVLVIAALMPWMDRWGATEAEIAASFSGDELVPAPHVLYNRAVTVNAPPEEIYPWLVQMGAERGGMYSYSWFETNILRCELINADRIHEEWQDLTVGDKVKMCPGNWGPPAYEVAMLEPNQALVIGHQENGKWSDVWQFILVPQTDDTTRLIARGRDMKSGGIWDVIRPGQFIMERGMLLGIKEQAEHEHLAESRGIPSTQEIAPESSTNLETVSLSEFGPDISLSYDSNLASKVEIATVPAVPPSDQILFAGWHPAYAQIRFPDFQSERPYDLPILASESRVAQVMVFRTSDFPGYGDDNPFGFVGQQQALAELLKAAVASDRCTKPFFTGYDLALPFLPWINMKQVFCAQPKMIEFPDGKGIRYLSYYSQGLNPVLDQDVFYTFQGLTNDGQFYVSAFFPVQTGIFPTEPSPCSICGDPNYDPSSDWMDIVAEQLTQLNAQSPNAFVPSLGSLDEVIQSIQISQ